MLSTLRVRPQSPPPLRRGVLHSISVQKKKNMTFTRKNVLRAVWEVKNTDRLGYCLGVPESKQNDIKEQFPSDHQVKEGYINYLMDYDPAASWRSVIVALDRMGEKEAADKIRNLAEPITDNTLNITNLCLVMASVKNWYSMAQFHYGLGASLAARNAIWLNTDYKTEEEKKEAFLKYFLDNVPMASWQSVAGVLLFWEEKTALQMVKEFLPPLDPSVTSKNLSTVLDSMDDGLWWRFSSYANMPPSERERIESQYSSVREQRQAFIHSLTSTHPALSWAIVARALYLSGWDFNDESCLRALDRLQQLFPIGRYRSKLIYENEMKKGHFELIIDKVIMFGLVGSGKTCSLHVLVGLPPPDTRNSTPLMTRPVEVMFVCVTDQDEWKIRTLEDMRDTVAEIIKSRMAKQQTESQSSDSPASPSQQPSDSQSPQPTTEKTSISTSETVEKSTPSSMGSRVQSDVEEVSLDFLLQSTNVDEEFVSLINSVPPSCEPILRLRQILVLDSGGQPHFHELLPVFLNGASKFAYVFKVHESLKDRTVIQYFKENKLVREFPASLTNEETLKLCTRSMRSLNTKNPDISPSKLLFLATHRDMVLDEKLPGVLDALHKKLREILLPQFKEHLLYCNEEMEDFIFTLNAANPGKKDKECAEAIRECLKRGDEGRKVVKVPLRWHALYLRLLEVMGGLGKKVLSREQCQQVAESMEIDEESCEECLLFFNGLNTLFYFPKILPHLVFLEPQMLLDKVTELVEESYRMKPGKKEKSLKVTSGERLKFRDYGQVTEKFLSEFESHYEPPLFTPKELIILMKGLLVFADLSKDVYFMPCLLQVVTSEVVSRYRVSGEKALALHFPNSGPLMGMFCSTVAYLLSPKNAHPCPWKVVENMAGTPECLNRNVINFTVSDFAGTVSLVDHVTHFEIHVDTHPKKTAKLWQLVHDAVFGGLNKAGKTLGYKDNIPVPAIICPAHPATPHPATFDKDHVWKCSQVAGHYGDVAEDIPWMSVCSTHTAEVNGTNGKTMTNATPEHPTTGERLTLLEPVLLDVSRRVGANYYKFGVFLLNDETGCRVSAFKKECQGDAENVMLRILQEWLEGKGLPVTWQSLVETLRNMKLNTLATTIAAKKLSAEASDMNETTKTTSQYHTTAADERPTLPVLLFLDVPQEVGTNYFKFGVFLLNDETGSRVSAFKKECQGNAEDVMMQILQEWLEGKGLPVTWQSLVETLRNMKLNTLATTIGATKFSSPEASDINDTTKITSQYHTTAADEAPTLPDLLLLNMPQEVGANYFDFGIFLLNDETGSRVSALKKECQGDPEDVMLRILQEWLEGKGLPVTWQSLICALRNTGLPALADQVDDAVTGLSHIPKRIKLDIHSPAPRAP